MNEPERPEKRPLAWLEREPSQAPPLAAATVILVRDAEGGLEALMLRRNSKIAFGGMWVFPGGKVDPADRAGVDPADALACARRAAVREAVEEASLAVAEESLVPFSHWTPPPIAPVRFATWFFLARAPSGQVTIDQGEIHEHVWLRPAEVLRRRDAGEVELAPPTFVTLHELARSPDVEHALALARTREPERFETRIAKGERGIAALWHGDAGYEAGDASAAGPRHRLWMLEGGWLYERDA